LFPAGATKFFFNLSLMAVIEQIKCAQATERRFIAADIATLEVRSAV
jgi:hypothetical protein